MTKESLAAFVDFVELDVRCTKLEAELAALDTQREAVDQELTALDQEIETVRQEVHNTQKSVDALELEIKTIDTQVSRLRQKLLVASSQKELDALTHEQADLKKRRSSHDEQGLALLEALEQGQQKLSELIAGKPKKEQALKSKQLALHDKQQELKDLLASLQQRKSAVHNHIDQEYLDQYNRMRQQITNPAVPIVNETCSGCFQGLSKPECIKAQKGSVVTCRSCFRLLYNYSSVHGGDEHEQSV